MLNELINRDHLVISSVPLQDADTYYPYARFALEWHSSTPDSFYMFRESGSKSVPGQAAPVIPGIILENMQSIVEQTLNSTFKTNIEEYDHRVSFDLLSRSYCFIEYSVTTSTLYLLDRDEYYVLDKIDKAFSSFEELQTYTELFIQLHSTESSLKAIDELITLATT